MKQFYEAYCDSQIVSSLMRQLPWSHHLIILGQSKRPEDLDFYLRMAIQERWSSRQLERQIKAALFEQAVINPPKVAPAVRQTHPEALSIFRDSYTLEFLGLPPGHMVHGICEEYVASVPHQSAAMVASNLASAISSTDGRFLSAGVSGRHRLLAVLCICNRGYSDDLREGQFVLNYA